MLEVATRDAVLVGVGEAPREGREVAKNGFCFFQPLCSRAELDAVPYPTDPEDEEATQQGGLRGCQ